jgi:hypothetical protein
MHFCSYMRSFLPQVLNTIWCLSKTYAHKNICKKLVGGEEKKKTAQIVFWDVMRCKHHNQQLISIFTTTVITSDRTINPQFQRIEKNAVSGTTVTQHLSKLSFTPMNFKLVTFTYFPKKIILYFQVLPYHKHLYYTITNWLSSFTEISSKCSSRSFSDFLSFLSFPKLKFCG